MLLLGSGGQRLWAQFSGSKSDTYPFDTRVRYQLKITDDFSLAKDSGAVSLSDSLSLTLLLRKDSIQIESAEPSKDADTVQGPSQERIIADLAHQLLIYSNTYDAYVPFVPGQTNYTTNVSFWIDTRQYNQYLQLPVHKDLCLYANGRLVFRFTGKGVRTISLGYLSKEIGTSKLFLTLYHPEGNLPFADVKIAASPISQEEAIATIASKKQYAFGTLLPRPGQRMDNSTVLLLLGAIALYIILKNVVPRNFVPLFSLEGFGERSTERFNNAGYRIDNSFTIVLLVVNVAVISYTVYLLTRASALPSNLSEVTLLQGFAGWSSGGGLLVVNFFLLGLIYIIGKYILIQGMGQLFGLQRISPIHYYEFLRFCTVLSVCSILLSLLTFSAHLLRVSQLAALIEILVLLFFFLRSIRVAILLSGAGRVRTIYLFSYLCATELIPIMLIARLIIDYHRLAGEL